MKNFFFIVIFFNFFFNWPVYSNESYVVLKVNNNVITNVDINNEYRYLIALSPSLQDVNKEIVMKLAKDSIIREKIKEGELAIHYDLSVKNKFIDKIISNFYKNMGMKNINEFKSYLLKYNLNFKEIERKISIEAAWNDLIYNKFSNSIEINELEIKQKLKKNILDDKEQNTYSISEILFVAEDYEKLQKKYKTIEKSTTEKADSNKRTKTKTIFKFASPNKLHKFASYTPLWTLSALSQAEIQEPKVFWNSQVQNVLHPIQKFVY